MTRRPSDVLVIGAGIVGAACAFELAREGIAVTVIDGDIPAGGATAAGMGHIVVMENPDPLGDLTLWSRGLWEALAASLPANAEDDPCGTLWVAATKEELPLLEAKRAWLEARNCEASILDPGALHRAEPELRPGLLGALLVPGDRSVYPPVAAAWMLERVLESGGRLLLGTSVRHVAERVVTLFSGVTLDAEAVVVAAGGHSLEILEDLPEGLRLRPRKGHLAITGRAPGFLRHQVVEIGYVASAQGSEDASIAFNVQPRTTGQVLIGSSRQFDRPSGDVEPPVLAAMLRRATTYLPRMRDLSVYRAWTGFRATTPDHLPYIGPIPDQPGMYLAAGHEGLGITTSLGTGRLIADTILGRPSPIDRSPFLPARMESRHP
jgi:glycine/D-amino acid oxidase-like deaminating enzyme